MRVFVGLCENVCDAGRFLLVDVVAKQKKPHTIAETHPCRRKKKMQEATF